MQGKKDFFVNEEQELDAELEEGLVEGPWPAGL